MEFSGGRPRFTDGPGIEHAQKPPFSLPPANHCKQSLGVCARAFRKPRLRVGLGLRMSRQRVRRFVPTGGKRGLHFLLAALGTSWPCGGCCKEERPDLRLCGVWSLPSAKHFSSGGRAPGKGGGEIRKDGHAGRGASATCAVRAALADPRLPPVSLRVWRCVNVQGS